ncbi:glycoside hydrolase family protein [Halosimplex sp. TS25]|uniref:glycoside hydrolase family protein n=1 Tax=Halosimplex rarum TaxID=3396619 RepID=UPI0039EC2D96
MSPSERRFRDRLRPAPRDGGFAMDDYWIWGASVVPGDDAYHMFASRWSKEIPFSPGWTSNSHVVRAEADSPEGPYEYAEDVIPPGEEGDWDRMSHNPSVVRAGDRYLLYYYGCHYEGPRPTPEDPHGVDRDENAVGVASAPSPAGPWTRHGPVIDGETNAVPVVDDDGSATVFVRDGAFELSVYAADDWADTDGYDLVAEHVLAPLEDHAVWRAGDGFELVAKDMQAHHDDGGYVDSYAGFHATSPDGVDWTVSDPPQAYPHATGGDRDLRVAWNDGGETSFPNVERAQVLVEDGVPTHLFLAVMSYTEANRADADSPAALPSHARWPADARNVCVPLDRPE